MKKYYKKELVYYIEDEKEARELKNNLYNKYNDVTMYVDGIIGYKIVVKI